MSYGIDGIDIPIHTTANDGIFKQDLISGGFRILYLGQSPLNNPKTPGLHTLTQMVDHTIIIQLAWIRQNNCCIILYKTAAYISEIVMIPKPITWLIGPYFKIVWQKRNCILYQCISRPANLHPI